MWMLTTRVLFAGLAPDNPHAYLGKLMVVWKSFVRQPDWEMDVIALRVFPPSMTGEVMIWCNELHYNSIHIWNQLTKTLLAKLFTMSKKYKLNNFIATIKPMMLL